MDFFNYKNNRLFCEDVALTDIARQCGTPTYVYSAATFTHHAKRLQDAFAEINPLICYSVKGCGNIHILRLLAESGCGFDIVSGGELFRVQKAGGDTSKIVYAGVGKTDEEIRQAIDAGIGWFNIESGAELENLIAIAAEMKATPRCALRVNPDVDPKTHRYTTTGKKETKFGVDIERAANVFAQYARNPHVRLTGIHLHLGSPINSADPYVQGINKAMVLIDRLRTDGFTVDTLDLGGGFGADYTTGQAPDFADFAGAIIPLLKGRNLQIILEPGRSISGNSGILLTRVLYTKKGGEKNFVIIDAGMNDLIRPAFYAAFHFIWPVAPVNGFVVNHRNETPNLPGLQKVDIVGPICETGDFLARDRMLPPLARGDLLAVFTAGAYAFAMSSQYNARPRTPEILVTGDSFRTIRRRETYNDLIAPELI
ncbi:MAG: diaminopimelate decarboxylase [Sedimentisphaerales bacterium]|nr:diaminopimelate decarboxylase [Sedimentisphaerales bacterium]